MTAPVPSTVAIIDLDKNEGSSLRRALDLIGGVDDLNNAGRSVVVKVGVYHPATGQHTSVGVVDAITRSFDRAPRIYLAESDNYRGTGSERLQVWKNLFTDRVVPFNLSEDTDTLPVRVGDEATDLSLHLSHILFKPNVFIDTHVLRSYAKGSILKNLFGLIPTPKKVQYHTIICPLLADLYEAIGGIDLAVLDATYFFHKTTSLRVRTNTLLVGRDAVAVEAVGATLAGLRPQRMPVLQEFVKRGLGEGDLDRIEIVGVPFDETRDKFTSVARQLTEMAATAPKPWSPAKALDKLIRQGFFKLPNRRTREEVERALEEDDARAKGRSKMIYTNLRRRMKMGRLKGAKGPDGWSYWRE